MAQLPAQLPFLLGGDPAAPIVTEPGIIVAAEDRSCTVEAEDRTTVVPLEER